MMRSALRTRLLAATLVVAAAASVLPTMTAWAQSPAIQLGAVAHADGAISIKGTHLAGSAVTVTLGNSPLAVTSASDTEIVAAAPALAAGVYALIVSRDGSPEGTASTILLVE